MQPEEPDLDDEGRISFIRPAPDWFRPEGETCTVPIVLEYPDRLAPQGTAFWVADGIVFTAKHVLTLNDDGTIPANLRAIVCEMDGTFHVQRLGRVKALRDGDFAFAEVLPRDRTWNVRKAHVSPVAPRVGMNITMHDPQVVNCSRASAGRWQVDVVHHIADGIVTEHYPHGRDRTMLPSDSFETTMPVPHGASGAPVYAPGPTMFGVCSSALQGDVPSYITAVLPILGRPTEEHWTHDKKLCLAFELPGLDSKVLVHVADRYPRAPS